MDTNNIGALDLAAEKRGEALKRINQAVKKLKDADAESCLVVLNSEADMRNLVRCCVDALDCLRAAAVCVDEATDIADLEYRSRLRAAREGQ